MTEFESIYNQYFREVYSFVLSLSRNDKVAEEITQETFFKALKNIDKFKGNSKLSVWLCQIAKNTYFTYLDKQKRFVTDEIPKQASEKSIGEMILNKEETFRLHKVLHHLEEPYKEVFTLRVFGELSFKEMALLNAIVDFHCGRTLSVGHAPILLGAKLLRCIGLHAYPTGVAALRYNQQRKITKINIKR